jgi:hypothetical protein
LKKKKNRKKRKRMPLFLGSGGMKTSFLAKKYYPTIGDKLKRKND